MPQRLLFNATEFSTGSHYSHAFMSDGSHEPPFAFGAN